MINYTIVKKFIKMSIWVKALRFMMRKSLLKELQNAGSVHSSLKLGYIHDFEINSNLKNLIIKKNIKFYNHVNIIIGKNAVLEVDENTTINKYTSIVALEKITIGQNCLIGENVKIYDNNHRVDIQDGAQFASHKEFTTSPVKIGNNCWLGSNVTILKGVTIGDNSIIGAGCTIYKDVPANTTVINKQELIFKNKG